MAGHAPPPALLAPAIGLANRLSYRKKLWALTTVFIAAIAILGSGLTSLLLREIRTAEQQLAGLELLPPVTQLVQSLQRLRGLSAGMMAGGEWALDLHETETQTADQAFEQLARRLPPSLANRTEWQAIRIYWDQLKRKGPNWGPSENYEAHTDLIRKLLFFEGIAVDEFALNRHTNAGTYYLIDSIVSQFPNVFERAGRIRASGIQMLSKAQDTAFERVQLLGLTNEANDNLLQLHAKLERIGQLRPHIAGPMAASSERLQSAMQPLLQVMHAEVITGKTLLAPDAYYGTATRAIDHGYAILYDTILPTARMLLLQQKHQALGLLVITLSMVLLLLAGTVYFALGVYHAMIGSVRKLADGAQAFAQGELKQRIDLGIPDELHQVGESFNRMAEQIGHMLEVQRQTEVKLREANDTLEATVAKRTQALAEAEERWGFALESAGDGVWDWDMQTNGVFYSDRYKEVLGITEAWDNLADWQARAHPEDMPHIIASIQHHLRQKDNSFAVEHRMHCADGMERWMLSRGKVVQRDAQGKPLRMIGIQSDITERKRIEDQLKQSIATAEAANRQLLSTNQRLTEVEFALDRSGIATYWIHADNGRILGVNSRACEMLGFSREELLDMNAVGINPRISLTRFREASSAMRQSSTGRVETVNRTRDGSYIPVEATYYYLEPTSDFPGHFIIFNTEISERQQAQRKLAQAYQEAEAASRAKSDFLANMSHEIRTPMNAIIGLSHLCLESPLPDGQRDYLEKIHSASKALLGILNDILDVSKIEAGKLEMEHIRFELEDVINNLTTVVAQRAEDKKIELLIESAIDIPPHLIGDPLRLGQVLINLVSNAIKFTDEGEVVLRIEPLNDSANATRLRFSVRDTGIGMSQDQIDKLFQPFTQADNSITRRYGGTGLGLTISQRLVDMMGGTIEVHSSPGQGTEFSFTADFQKPVETKDKTHHPLHQLRELRVLVADDNESACLILEHYLMPYTFRVDSVHDGQAALRAAKAAQQEGLPYDLVILDWKMPVLDGIETARALRALSQLEPPPRILLMSAYGKFELMRHMEHNLVDGVLAKPFHPSGLFDAIVRVFGHPTASADGWHPGQYNEAKLAHLRGHHLLVVDDNEINRIVARELLTKVGALVSLAGTGKEALARLKLGGVDAVLMDLQMPEMDGITATREIRRQWASDTLPVIAMTANTMSGDRQRCLDAGMNDHIAKPIDPANLYEVLAHHLTPLAPGDGSTASDTPAALTPPHIPAAALPRLPGLDTTQGIQQVGGDTALYLDVLFKFHDRHQQAGAQLHVALSSEAERATAERMVHTLKGLAGSIGAHDLATALRQLEALILDNAPSHACLAQCDHVDQGLSHVLTSIAQLHHLRPGTAEPDLVDEDIDALITQARTLLAQFNTAAEEPVAQLAAALTRTPWADQAQRLRALTHGYDYEGALTVLQQLAQDLPVGVEF